MTAACDGGAGGGGGGGGDVDGDSNDAPPKWVGGVRRRLGTVGHVDAIVIQICVAMMARCACVRVCVCYVVCDKHNAQKRLCRCGCQTRQVQVCVDLCAPVARVCVSAFVFACERVRVDLGRGRMCSVAAIANNVVVHYFRGG